MDGSPVPAKSPAVAALLSLVVPGAGHLWLGQGFKGALLFGGCVLLVCFTPLPQLAVAWDAWAVAHLRIAQGRELADDESGPLFTWLGKVAAVVLDLFG